MNQASPEGDVRPRCSCTIASYSVAGKHIENIDWLDPDCRVHGLPKHAGWPAGHPLRRHARMTTETKTRMIGEGRRNAFSTTWELERLETPREVERRLLTETSAAKPAPDRKAS